MTFHHAYSRLVAYRGIYTSRNAIISVAQPVTFGSSSFIKHQTGQVPRQVRNSLHLAGLLLLVCLARRHLGTLTLAFRNPATW